MRIIATIAILFSCLPSMLCQYKSMESDSNDKPAILIETENIDTCLIDVIYRHTAFDPGLKEEQEFYEILQIGKNYSKYADYGKFRLDSAICTSKNKIITCRQWDYLSQLYQSNIYNYSDFAIKNYSKQIIKVGMWVFIDKYLYTEPQPEIQWKLIDSTRTICGHLCHKATTIFRGRRWIAWYCYDIPSDNGPWKFGGLPGLILSISDAKLRHQFNAILIRKGYGEIKFEKCNYIKSTRKAAITALKKFVVNGAKMFEGMVWNADGTPAELPKTRLFYSPIELQ